MIERFGFVLPKPRGKPATETLARQPPGVCFTKMKGPLTRNAITRGRTLGRIAQIIAGSGERASLLRANNGTGGQPASETLGPAGSQGTGQLR
jgi:hypothetical protein